MNSITTVIRWCWAGLLTGMTAWLVLAHASSPWLLGGVCLVAGILAMGPVAVGRNAWLTALPIVVVAGSWYPWTGTLLWEERDALLSIILAGLLWRESYRLPHWSECWWWLPLVVMAAVAVVRGINVLPQSIPGDALSYYRTQTNSLGIAKSILLAAAFLPPIFQAISLDHTAWHSFSMGMRLSAAWVAIVVIAERMVTVGLFDFSEELRAAGPLTSMHIGGQHIDAFWALALPFVFQFVPGRWRIQLWTAALQILAAYAMVATMSRALIGYAAASIGLMMLLQLLSPAISRQPAMRSFTWQRWIIRCQVVALAGLLLAGIFILWSRGEAIKARFYNTSQDWQQRVAHWRDVFGIFSAGSVADQWLGRGLGTYPTVYRRSTGEVPQPISLTAIDGEFAVKIYAGEKIYFEQWLPTTLAPPLTLQTKLIAASDETMLLSGLLCHKVLLQSYDCSQASLVATEPGGKIYTATFSTTPMEIAASDAQAPQLRSWCPVSLAIAVSGAQGDWAELTDIRLLDRHGRSLLANGDFQRGSQRWLFTSDDHLAWRAKNLFLHLLLEWGWLGLISFVCLIAGTFITALHRLFVSRSHEVLTMIWSLAGFLAMGLFGTLVDVPWLMLLLLVSICVTRACCKNRRLRTPEFLE